ncbi:MAG: SAM-dependent methyltransferase, partial [Deltaproteobacteria bacterium]
MARRFRKSVRAKEVRRELLPGQSTELLRHLGLLDAEGNLHADSRRKLKQVNHLVRLLEPALEDLFARHQAPVLVDAGAGNAYLGFVLYELFLAPAGRGELWCIEQNRTLIEQVAERAFHLGYDRVRTVLSDIAASEMPERVHLLTALHACDTATDDALLRAIELGVDYVAVVPCCQAEVARQLAALQGPQLRAPSLRQLWRHAWHRREFGAHLTNVVRALVLEAHGYKVTVTELTGWEHSLKNELILGRRVHRDNLRARRALRGLLREIPVRPHLVEALGLAPGPEAGRDAGKTEQRASRAAAAEGAESKG